MVGRIITVRHGRPNVDRNVRITAEEYGAWWQNYDKSGLAPGEAPPDKLRAVAAECDTIVCSTMPRAIETAASLVDDGRIVPQDAMFVEAPLPPPPVPWIKLSPTMWGRVSRVFWFLGYAPGGAENHAQVWRRVGRLSRELIGYANKGDDVLLCAHGYLNWMIDAYLRRRGWDRVAHEGNNDFWSWRAYRLDSGKQVAQETSEKAEAGSR